MVNLPDITNIEFAIHMPIMALPARTTAVRLAKGVIVFSPGPDVDLGPCAQLGPVTDIVAPNLFHHLGVKRASEQLPNARLWGAPGLAAKRHGMRWDAVLSPDTWPYQDELPIVVLQGMPKVNEAVFFHKKSRTLLVTDLCFNILHPRGVGAWIILHVFSTYGRFGVSRLIQRMVTDKAAFERSLTAVFAFDFENLLMAHGDIVMGGARERLRAALLEKNFRAAP